MYQFYFIILINIIFKKYIDIYSYVYNFYFLFIPLFKLNAFCHGSVFVFLKCKCFMLNCSVVSDSGDLMDYSPPGSSVHGTFQLRTLEPVAIFYSRVSSQPRDQVHISCISWIGRWLLSHVSHLESQNMGTDHQNRIKCSDCLLQKHFFNWVIVDLQYCKFS